MSDQKNMIMAAALSFLVILVWQIFVAPPPPAPDSAVVAEQSGNATDPAAPAPQAVSPTSPQSLPRAEVLEEGDRIRLSTPSLRGSVSLRGGRIDDLTLVNYRETLEPESPEVVLLSPTRTTNPYYGVWGWIPAQGSQTGPTPGANTDWQLESGNELTPGSPITLRWDNGAGLIFRRTIAVDERYLFTVTQSVENTTGNEVSLVPYGIVARHGAPDTIGFWILHEGAIASADGTLTLLDYDEISDLETDPVEGAPAQRIGVDANGWLGFTDKYWLAAMAGGPERSFTGVFKSVPTGGGPVFQSDLRQNPVTVAPGARADTDSLFFAGAKDMSVLTSYERNPGIADLTNAVDWGWFFFLTRPLFTALMFIHGIVGNMGWSIILLTVVLKALLFPLAYKSFVSMSKMKQLQPEMEAIKERCGDDKQKMQQEMINLYKTKKVNPASGCLPILVQIPIFFSLYKVFFVTIELRHAPFILWIEDLSAPDPTSILNLFGLLPYSVDGIPGFLALFSIGVFPVLMGITMWMQQKLNPAPTDPTQAQIFAILPFMFMFMLGQFASGLVIYWVANNIITFTQQYLIMRSQGVEVDFLGNVKRSFKRRRPAE
jgi:YidC/Oxa1 family membrane protein insertase